LPHGSGDLSTPDARQSARLRPEPPVSIVGAGPAGLACAIALRRAGRAVIVRERHAAAGHRFHGDFQGIENWSDDADVLDELGAAGIAASFDHRPVSGGIAFDSADQSYPLQSARPLFYLVRRGSQPGTLDRALFEQAVAAGVEVRLRDAVATPDGPAVLAAGPHSADAIAAGYLFDTDLADGAFLALDERLAPLGYAYLLVHGGHGTIASCMFTGFKAHAAHVARTVAFFREKVGLVMKNPRPFGGFANFRLPRRATQGGHPVIGEQAGFQDALAGFGMRYALRSGLLAARSVIEGVDYEALWRRELLPLLRAGVANRFLFNTLGQAGRRLALRRLSQADTGLVLHRLYRPWPLGRLVFPIARLRYRHVLRDRSCDHKDCQCVWCEHGAEETPPIACAEADRVVSFPAGARRRKA
jgi:hypothetical protein